MKHAKLVEIVTEMRRAMAGNIPTMALFISAPKSPAKPSLSHRPGSAVPLAVSVFYWFLYSIYIFNMFMRLVKSKRP